MASAEVLTPAHVVYRRLLHQARLFAHIWRDPVLYASHRTIGRARAEEIVNLLHRHTGLVSTTTLSPEEAKYAEPPKHVNKFGKMLRNAIARRDAPQAHALAKVRKRLTRAYQLIREDIKHLAAANVGWPHAVERSLEEGYGRRGFLRHALLAPFLPKHDVQTGRLKARAKTGQPPEEPNPALPRRQQSPDISPSLRTLVLSTASHSASAPNPNQLDLPPKLAVAMQKKRGLFPSENEAVAMLSGPERNLQAIGISRRVEANARWRWLTTHIRKVQPPIEFEADQGDESVRAPHVRFLESAVLDRQPTIPKRMRRALEEANDTGGEAPVQPPQPMPKTLPPRPYLAGARRVARELGRGGEAEKEGIIQAPFDPKARRPPRLVTEEAHLNYNLVKHGGWARSGPTDFERDHRARRRMLAALLDKIPIVEYPDQGAAKTKGKTPPKEGLKEGTETPRLQVRFGIPEATEPDSAEEGVGAASKEQESATSEAGAAPPRIRSSTLPTLQARSSANRLLPAYEWMVNTDYGLAPSAKAGDGSKEAKPQHPQRDDSARQGKKKEGSGVPRIARVRRSELSRQSAMHGRAVRPDSDKFVRRDELWRVD